MLGMVGFNSISERYRGSTYTCSASALIASPNASLAARTSSSKVFKAGTTHIFCENLYEIFKIIGYAIVTIKKRGWLYGYDLKNNCPL